MWSRILRRHPHASRCSPLAPPPCPPPSHTPPHDDLLASAPAPNVSHGGMDDDGSSDTATIVDGVGYDPESPPPSQPGAAAEQMPDPDSSEGETDVEFDTEDALKDVQEVEVVDMGSDFIKAPEAATVTVPPPAATSACAKPNILLVPTCVLAPAQCHALESACSPCSPCSPCCRASPSLFPQEENWCCTPRLRLAPWSTPPKSV